MARIYRFFLRNKNINLDQQNPTLKLSFNSKNEPEIFFQLFKVLRVKIGDQLLLLNKNLYSETDNKSKNNFIVIPEFLYEVINITKHELILAFKTIRFNQNENLIGLDLALCLPNKPAKLDFIIEKAVELGASKIRLLKSDFSSFNHQLRFDRLEKIIIEASEQSERGFIPELEQVLALKDFLKNPPPHLLTALERELGSNQEIKEKIQDDSNDLIEKLDQQIEMIRKNHQQGENLHQKNNHAITLLIGPEGGFSPQEKNTIYQLQLKTFSLGRRILRMETATILTLGITKLRIDSV